MRLSSSKIVFESACHSVPSGSVMLRNPSGDFTRHSIRSDEKFAALICSSGEYFEFARSPPYVGHSPVAVDDGGRCAVAAALRTNATITQRISMRRFYRQRATRNATHCSADWSAAVASIRSTYVDRKSVV